MGLVSANPGAFFAMTASLGDVADAYFKRQREKEASSLMLGAFDAALSGQGQEQPQAAGSAPVRSGLPIFAAGGGDAGRASVLGALGAGVANKYDANGPDRAALLGEYVENGTLSGVDPELQRRALAFLNDNPHGVGIRSGYRSVEKQQQLWNAALAKYGSPEAARKWVAPPGSSNHNHGRAFDLSYESPEATAWAHQNAAAYGLKFPLGNENWHVEPVETRGGRVRLAQAGASDAPLPLPAGQFLAQRQAAMSAPQAGAMSQQGMIAATRMMLANPDTRAFGQQMWQALAQPKTSPFDFQVVGDSLVRVNKMTGEAVPVPGMGKTPSPVTLSQGQVLVDPRTGARIAAGAEKPVDLPSSAQEFQFARQNGFRGSYEDFLQTKAGTGIAATVAGVEARKQAAAAAGIAPDSPGYQTFLATGKMPREDQQPLSATDKKAILEADEGVLAAETAIGSLNKAKELSKQAMSGPFARLSGAGALVSHGASIATQELDNVVTTNALAQLKAIFGAAPTEGERKILLDIQGSSSQPDAVRQKIYDRAIEMANRRLAFNRQRASEMRGGTFYKQGGGRTAPAPAGAPLEQARDAIARGAPRDAVIQRLRENGIDPEGL